MELDADEKQRQDSFVWNRSSYHATYNQVLTEYKVKSCLEHARGSSLLDLACGDGKLTEVFAQQFQRVVGVDASSKHLDQARLRCAEIEFHDSLVEDLHLDERFDTVVMLDVLEHVIDPVAFLKKAASFLAPGGVLIVHVPNSDAVNRKIAVLMGTLESCDELTPFDLEIAGHRRSYNLASLQTEVAAAGLQLVTTGGIFYKMLSTAQIDWFLANGEWEGNVFGWGRVGSEPRDWRAEFARACYEFGKDRPADCNVVFAVAAN